MTQIGEKRGRKCLSQYTTLQSICFPSELVVAFEQMIM